MYRPSCVCIDIPPLNEVHKKCLIEDIYSACVLSEGERKYSYLPSKGNKLIFYQKGPRFFNEEETIELFDTVRRYISGYLSYKIRDPIIYLEFSLIL